MKNKGRFFFVLLIKTGLATYAQSPDSPYQKYDSLAKVKSTKLDPTTSRLNQKIDSVQSKINTALNPNLNNLTHKLALKRKPMDSVHAVHELDSMKGKLTNQIDSLKNLNLPTDKLTRKLDSLNQISPTKYIQQAESKMDELQSKINKPIDNVEDKINEKLGLMSKEGGANTNIPGSADLPGADLNTNLNASDKLNLPGTDLNAKNPLGEVENPLKDEMGEVNELKEKISDVKNAPQEQIDKIKSIDEIQGAQEKLDQANELTDKAQAYQSDVKNIAQGNIGEVKELPNAIEEKAKNLDEVKALEMQTDELNKYQEMIGKGNDPEAMKELAKQQAVTYAKDHFAGKQEVLQAAMDKMSKLKSKYSELNSLKDIPRRVPNAMKGKPLIERVVPGITLQIQKTSNVLIDFNPVISYRISGRWNAGAGWNERVSFSKWNKTVPIDRIYGPRAFTSFSFKKGFALKAEGEKMNAWIPPFPGNADPGYRRWVWSAFIGIKKDYQFMKGVKGNFQFLYNLYDDHDQSPYTERLSVRFGFEFPLKKNRKRFHHAGT